MRHKLVDNHYNKPEILTAYDRDGLYELILNCDRKRIWSCKTNISEINSLINKDTMCLYDSITYDDVDFYLKDIRIENEKMRIIINISPSMNKEES